MIYTLDHEPPDVHLAGAGQAKVDLIGANDCPALVYSIGIKRADMRRLMTEVENNRALFLLQWEAIHGRRDG